ncbi:hypothetical protein [Halosimplex sp. J119]
MDRFESETFSTEEIYNDEEPNIDISHPSWRALTRALVVDYYQVPSGLYNSVTTGSGSTKDSYWTDEVSTGSTSGSTSHLHLGLQGRDLTPVPWTWDKNRWFCIGWYIMDAETDRTDYLTSGRVAEGEPGFGMKIENGEAKAVAHDGSAETVGATLLSDIGTGTSAAHTLWAQLDAGEEVSIWMDKHPTENPADATLSQTIPTGTTQSMDIMSAYVTNSTAADRRLRWGGFRVVQEP